MEIFATTCLILFSFVQALAWTSTYPPSRRWGSTVVLSLAGEVSKSRLNFFSKMFEEEGVLGKGIMVGKVQIALNSPDRGPDSIFGILEREAEDSKSLPELTNSICLALLRKKDFWIGAAGISEWFSQNDAGKAESRFNDYANKEAFKFEKVTSFRLEKNSILNFESELTLLFLLLHFFEKEYIPDSSSDEKGGASTIVVVSLVVEIEGDSTK